MNEMNESDIGRAQRHRRQPVCLVQDVVVTVATAICCYLSVPQHIIIRLLQCQSRSVFCQSGLRLCVLLHKTHKRILDSVTSVHIRTAHSQQSVTRIIYYMFYTIHNFLCHLNKQHVTNRRTLIIRFCIYYTHAANKSDMFRSLVGTIVMDILLKS